MKRIAYVWMPLLLLGLAVLLSACPQQASEVGNDVCLQCHNGLLAPDQSCFPESIHRFLDCERCHGPGSAHVRNGGQFGLFIVNPADEPFETHFELCQQCHPGQAEQYVQSAHYLNPFVPVRCTDCHNVHSPDETILPFDDNSLCLDCHAPFGFQAEDDIEEHTFHSYNPVTTGASRCTPCHMPPLQRDDQADGPHLHTWVPIQPIESNIAMDENIVPTPPNSCSGIMGCHDGTVPEAPIFDVDNPDDNALLQLIYEARHGED